MASLSTALLLTLILAGKTMGGFCNAFSSGPVANNNFIRAANSTLIVPHELFPRNNLLSLWTGMGMSNRDLIQALVESYNGTVDPGCGVLNNRTWCAWASALVSQGQIGGRQLKVFPGDRVKQSYIYHDADQMWHQAVYVNERKISTLVTSSGVGLGWGTAEECQPGAPCGYVPAHDWVDTVLVFENPDPTYNETFSHNGASGTLVTRDGGKTWRGLKIHINACNFTVST